MVGPKIETLNLQTELKNIAVIGCYKRFHLSYFNFLCGNNFSTEVSKCRYYYKAEGKYYSEEFNLERITRDPPEGYLVRIPFYVKGSEEAKIQLFGSEGAIYEIGILDHLN